MPVHRLSPGRTTLQMALAVSDGLALVPLTGGLNNSHKKPWSEPGWVLLVMEARFALVRGSW